MAREADLFEVSQSEARLRRPLRDREWGVIKPFLPAPKGFGHPRNVDLREILGQKRQIEGCVPSRVGIRWDHSAPAWP